MADEQTPKPEGQAAEGTAQGEQKPSKNKKINKLSLDEINKKIEELSTANHIQSRYYHHLLTRKSELNPS